MLLMVEKGIIDGICQEIHRYAKTNNKYMTNYDKSIISSYLMYLDANNLDGQPMSQKFPVNGFEWVKSLSKFDERFIKIMMKTVISDIFSKQMLNIQNIYLIFIRIFHFYLKERKSENVISLFVSLAIRKNMLFA